VTVLGVDAAGKRHLYFPVGPAEPVVEGKPLGKSTWLREHAEGRLQIFALFTQQPLSPESIDRAVEDPKVVKVTGWMQVQP